MRENLLLARSECLQARMGMEKSGKGGDVDVRKEIKDALLHKQPHVPVELPLPCGTVHLKGLSDARMHAAAPCEVRKTCATTDQIGNIGCTEQSLLPKWWPLRRQHVG